MAHVQKLPDGALDAIAEQVGRLYPSLDNTVTQRQPSAELTETFPVWFLSIDAVNTGNDNLLELAQDTLRWHSQISIDGKPEGVVRTMASGDDASDWTVRQIHAAHLHIPPQMRQRPIHRAQILPNQFLPDTSRCDTCGCIVQPYSNRI